MLYNISLSKGCCVSECILKEAKIYADGKIDKNAAISYLTEKTKSNEALKPVKLKKYHKN